MTDATPPALHMTKVYASLLSLAAPMLLGPTGHVLLQLTDTVMVGRVGPVALAGAALAGSVVMLALYFACGSLGSVRDRRRWTVPTGSRTGSPTLFTFCSPAFKAVRPNSLFRFIARNPATALIPRTRSASACVPPISWVPCGPVRMQRTRKPSASAAGPGDS